MQKDDLQYKSDDLIEVEASEVLKILWLNKKFIFAVTGVFAFLSLIYSLLLSNVYTSQALLTPTLQNSNNLSSQYSGLAAVAGISLDNSKPDVSLAIAFIKSKKIIRKLMKHETFLPDLMAAKKWDKKSNSIIYEDNIYDNENKEWVRKINFPFQLVPSEQEAYRIFSNQINISEDKRNKLLTLSVEHMSPFVAQQWVEWIIVEANSMVANLRIEEAENSINYLNEQIKLTPYAELRTMFFNLIQKNTESMMLAKVNKQYALTIIDPPLISEFKSKPIRRLILILGTLLGVIVSISIVCVRKYVYKREDELDILNLPGKLSSNFYEYIQTNSSWLINKNKK